MKGVLLFCLGIATLVVALAVMGVVLVRARRLVSGGHRRYAALSTVLVGAVGLWLMQRARFSAGFAELDVMLTLGLVGVFTWVPVWASLRYAQLSQAHVTDLHESSMLSMLHVGSRQDKPGFEDTIAVQPDDEQVFVKTEASPLR